jgi:hypothetical protein
MIFTLLNSSKGSYWQIDKEMIFPMPMQLAVETPATVIFLELVAAAPVSTLSPALSCYAKLGWFTHKNK